MSQNTRHHKPLLVQAPVRALDPDGVAVVSFGTLGFAVGAGVCWANYDTLTAGDDGWWFWVALNGVLIGLMGLVFSLRRRSVRQRRPDDLDA